MCEHTACNLKVPTELGNFTGLFRMFDSAQMH